MAPQPRAISLRHHRHLFLLLAVTAVVTRAATADMEAAAPSATETRSTASAPAASFLRACCATTLYPALCYDSLLPYAPEFQTSHARLARVAADVTAAHLRALSARVKDLLLHATRPDTAAGGRPSEAAALHDCASTISSAANLARQSSAELTGLDAAGSTTPAGTSSRQARWQVSNAKTWLSAAMTNEGTCTDGLEEAGAAASLAGKEVTAGVASVRQYTSNSLALVNGIPL
ncbi:21 kDa protein-like [Phragmites australis]|uniref:21 kDa protein-like n=1 Tax=Phragmites australis TaxID=29695 RepID=UPI002D7A045B|nr:21 kDa protein-like [Phragmites australis]